MYLLWIYENSLAICFVAFMAMLLIAMEVGTRIGLWRRGHIRASDSPTPNDVTLPAMLALLGLMLAFTYSFAMSRSDLRKQARVQEANAIGTAFLRSEQFAGTASRQLRENLLEYARSRVVEPDKVRTLKKLEEVIDRTRKIRDQIWPTTQKVLAENLDLPAPMHVSLVQAINAVLDADALRMMLIFDRIPAPVMLLLLTIAAICIGLTAHYIGLQGETMRWRMGLFALILSALLVVIIDFDMTLHGWIQVGQQSHLDLIHDLEASMEKASESMMPGSTPKTQN